MPVKLLIAVAGLLALSGCADFQTKSAQAAKQPYQRFVPVPRQPENLQGVPWSGALALDTKTGQLCQTYPESTAPASSPSSPPPKTAEEFLNKYESQQTLGWHEIPLCKHLYESVPD
jgi:hypothetical protein